MDSSKSSTSVMMSVSASGVLLPPYVVYKAIHLYPTWIEGGPEGAVYYRTRSGWFDGPTFENWFDQIVIPYFKNLKGKKVLIGDNLASHMSIHVLECCAKYDIEFVLLPPNATHILQPLDVAVFAPFKKSWRAILTEWKVTNRGCILKSEFPRLFKKAIENVTNMENNIMAGFRTCGIFPLDPDIVLNKIPDSTEDPAVNQEHWVHTLQDFLHESRLVTTQDTRTPGGKWLQVAPGKGINAQYLKRTENEGEEVFMLDSSGDDLDANEEPEIEDEQEINETDIENKNDTDQIETNFLIEIGTFVAVKFSCPNNNFKYFVGCVTYVIDNNKTYLVNFLRKVLLLSITYVTPTKLRLIF